MTALSRRTPRKKAQPVQSSSVTLLGRSEPSLTDQAYATLEEMIVTLRLLPGAASPRRA